jgi:hypothetical protein
MDDNSPTRESSRTPDYSQGGVKMYTTYRINLWFPSTCQSELGAATEYVRLLMGLAALSAAPTG